MAVTQGVTRAVHEHTTPLSSHTDHFVFTGAAKTVTVPAGAGVAVFGTTGAFYVRKGGTAEIPAADIVTGAGSAASPARRTVTPAETFSMVAASGVIVTIEWLKAPGVA